MRGNGLGSVLLWLSPGMRVKRWLGMLVVGITILSLGFAYLLQELYPLPAIFYYLTLQFIPRSVRGLFFGLLGVAAVGLAIRQLNRSLLAAVVPGDVEGVAQKLYRQRGRRRGPRIVAIGGGKGLALLLRGLKEHTSNLTAILTPGGGYSSSGEAQTAFREDLHRALAALADAEVLVRELLQYRFPAGDGLNGHSFGEMFLSAMETVAGGFERALEETSQVLAVRGQILPSTLEGVSIRANRLEGEGEGSKTLALEAAGPLAYPRALEAIRTADMIVIGPGSLYSQALPGLLIKELAEAIRASAAVKVFVCNLATEPGETDGYALSDHVRALHRHLGGGVIRVVLANRNLPGEDLSEGRKPVAIDMRIVGDTGVQVVDADLLDPDNPGLHHPEKLARALMALLPQ